MPDLSHALQGSDLGFLRMVASTWGFDLTSPDAYKALPEVVANLHNRALVEEVVESLAADARDALQELLDSDGYMPWAQFTRRFGEVREMGAARRDRERPHLAPISPAETLWYRALISRSFLNRPPEPQEFAFIPDDLVEFLPARFLHANQVLGRPASPAECTHLIPANDRIVDHACTLLAALRLQLESEKICLPAWGIPANSLKEILFSAHLLNVDNLPIPDDTREFLEAPRGEALLRLAQSWMAHEWHNDLRLVPGLRFDGDWHNDPRATRQAVCGLLAELPQETWWSISAFIAAVKEQRPDYQRPAGDYDSWFIRKIDSETYLRGFSCWDEVDGALLRYLITGPLHWLGYLDLASPSPGAAPTAFRPSAWSAVLWLGQPPEGLPVEGDKFTINSDGQLRLTNLVPRSVRYLLARFSVWEGESDTQYRYRLSPSTMEIARKQGLRISHLETLLRRHAVQPLPPNLIPALERWEHFGPQASIDKAVLLRVSTPDILTALQRTRAARYLGEILSPTTVIIKPGGEESVRSALAELGYLSSSYLDV